jgi:hypothetical protein
MELYFTHYVPKNTIQSTTTTLTTSLHGHENRAKNIDYTVTNIIQCRIKKTRC